MTLTLPRNLAILAADNPLPPPALLLAMPGQRPEDPQDAQPNPEPEVPSLPQPDPGVFHHEPPPVAPADPL